MDFGSDDGSDSEMWDPLSLSPPRLPVDVGKASFSQGYLSSSSQGYPSAVNILKPQIDKIFSEVQKNLPTIDFDSSDISSDNDEPIFFHHSLKLGDISSRFDDDKDLDTSLSGPDYPSPPIGSFQNVGSSINPLTCNTTTNIPATNTTSTSSGTQTFAFSSNNDNDFLEADTQPAPLTPAYDNDLAALLSKAKFPSPEEVGKWRTLAQRMEEDVEEDSRLEQNDLLRSQQLGHFSSRDNDNGLDSDDIRLSMADDNDTAIIEHFKQDAAIDRFNDRLREGVKSLDKKEKHQMLLEQARSKDEEIVSKLTTEEPTTLSMRLFQDIDLDSVLNQANEESIPLSSLRIVGNPSANQIPATHSGAGDGGSQSGMRDDQEELTLIQKLAQLSMAQSGSALAQGLKEVNSSFDPRTGAIVKKTDGKTKITSPKTPHRHLQEDTEIRHAAMKSMGTSSTTCSAGTSTSNMAAGGIAGKILYGRPRAGSDKKDAEPATVFIDLRGFEKQKEEEKMGLQSVQRVLGISGTEQEEESSSDDEEEMVERCNWRQTRQKLKEDLSTMGASATLEGIGAGSRGKADKKGYKKPPRVINLQEHSISRKWSASQSDNSRIQQRSGVEGQEVEEVVGDEAARSMSQNEAAALREREEDNKEIVAKQEAERELQRQREEARKLREAREKERESRIRMSKHIEAARSTATTQGRQDAGENTPAVFDFEASYEPSPSTLPTVLSPDRETVLLTIQLSSNGEIVQHRPKGHRSVDTGEGLSATYTALLSWLLSLVPHEFTFLENSTASSSSSSSSSHPNSNTAVSGFHVIGLQQMWYEEQLRLCVAVTPSQQFLEGLPRHSRSKKSKKDEVKNSSRFVQHVTKFLTVNTLHTVCPWIETLVSVPVQSQRSEDKGADSYSYEPPLPKISTKPLSTFVQVSHVTQAARDLFNVPVGYFWQTVDTDESWHQVDCNDTDVCVETQNTMSLVYKKIFHNPLSLMAILNRVSQEGLDLAGVRLIYPCQGLVELSTNSTTTTTTTSSSSSSSSTTSSSQNQQNKQQSSKSSSQQEQRNNELNLLNNIGPIFAMALRGTFARSIWLESVGPSDPQLARRTDPNSLCALYGGESRDSALLFCPRNPSRVQSELARWFGGHIAQGVVSVNVGIPYRPKDEVKVVTKKGRKSKNNNSDTDTSAHRHPAALTATSKSDIVMVVSPLVPPSYLGIVMATGQRRGYQVRGVKRILMTAKISNGLGIPPSQCSYFCPGARTEDIDQEHPVEAISPATVLLLRKENAAHNAASLIEAFMVQLTLAGLLGCVQMRLGEPMTSKHLFYAATYSEGLMGLMGRNFGKTPEFDLTYLALNSSSNPTVRKDLEQVAVVIILGHDALKKSGLCVGKILNVLPYSKTPLQPVLADRLELLGIKWVASLSIYQAKELTPFEVGDYRWRPSVKMLESEPALVLVVRGVNIFQSLKPLLEEQDKLDSGGRGFNTSGAASSSASNKGVKKISYLMSHNPSQSEVFTRLFFQHHELYPDPLARSLLPFMPEFRLYFNVLEETRENRKVKRVFSLKPLEELNLTLENVFQEMKSGQQPITSCLLVKPLAVKKHLAKILRRVAQEGFKVVGMRMLMLGEKMATEFIPACSRKAEKEESHVLENHLASLTSGPCLALALQQHNAIKRLCDLIGPEEPMSARRQSQFLWRGEFGSDIYNNAFYCSPYYVDAIRDIKILFPDGLCCEDSSALQYEQIPAPAEDSGISLHSSKTVQLSTPATNSHGGSKAYSPIDDVHSLLVQTNCLILTPPLMKLKSHSHHATASVDIINTLISTGFEPVALRLVWLTQRQAECLLSHLELGSFQQVSMLCRGPCLVMAVERDNAVFSFDSILQQTSQSSKLVEEYGHMMFRGTSIKQSHSLLKFFFQDLMPGSQLTICDAT